jgi:hypothetical protein
MSMTSPKTAATVLWKYTDGDNGDFYLPSKLTTVKSPWTGSALSGVKPTKSTMGDVGKELKEDAKKKEASAVDPWKAREACGCDAEASPDPWKAEVAVEEVVPTLATADDPWKADAVAQPSVDPWHVSASVVTAAGVLWKYTDEEGKEFYLEKRQSGTLKSPYSGKSFKAKPEKTSLADVGKGKKASDEQQDDQSKEAGELPPWLKKDKDDDKEKGQDKEAGELPPWLKDKDDEKDEKKDEGKKDKEASESDPWKAHVALARRASSPAQWEEAAEMLEQGEKHEAVEVLKEQLDEIVKALADAKKRNDNLKKVGAGSTEAPTFIISMVKPEVEKLAKMAAVVAKQMDAKFR